MPALQARRLRITLRSEIHVTEREGTVGGRARNQILEELEVARLRQRSLAVAHAHAQETANAVVVRCLKERAPHVGLPWHLVISGDRLAGCRNRRRLHVRCRTRHTQLQGWDAATLT